jgi:hypothetical protein
MRIFNLSQYYQFQLIFPRLSVEIIGDDIEQNKLIFGDPHIKDEMDFAHRILIKLLFDISLFFIEFGYQPIIYSVSKLGKEIIDVGR